VRRAVEWRGGVAAQQPLSFLPRTAAKVVEKLLDSHCTPLTNSQIYTVAAISFFMCINITLDKRRYCILNVPLTRSKIFQ